MYKNFLRKLSQQELKFLIDAQVVESAKIASRVLG